jgi:predicted DNA-binding protein (MmcQ/YjbR family)
VTQRLVDQVRRHCEHLAQGPGEFPFGDSAEVFKVGGRMFAYIVLSRDPEVLVLKLPLDVGEELHAVHPDAVTPRCKPHKPLWCSIRLEAGPIADELETLLDTSYWMVRSSLPKRVRATL